MENFHDPRIAATEDEGPVIIGTYADPIEADLARSVLQQAGIQCVLYDENSSNLGMGYVQLGGGLRLVVAAADAKQAKALLSQTGHGRGAPLR